MFDAWYVEPLSFEYCLVPVPPVAVTVISPSAAPLQLRSEPLYVFFVAPVIVSAGGAVIVTLVADVTQLLASFTRI